MKKKVVNVFNNQKNNHTIKYSYSYYIIFKWTLYFISFEITFKNIDIYNVSLNIVKRKKNEEEKQPTRIFT